MEVATEPQQVTIFGPGGVEAEDSIKDTATAEEAAALIAARVAEAQLVAEITSTRPPPLETSLAAPLPDELAGAIWNREPLISDEERAHDPDEKSDAESEAEGMASKLPPWKKPTIGDFAAVLRGMENRDEANDLDLSDDEGREAKPENVAKASVWTGVAGTEEPDYLPQATDFGEWDRCSNYSRATSSSYCVVNTPRLSEPPEELMSLACVPLPPETGPVPSSGGVSSEAA